MGGFWFRSEGLEFRTDFRVSYGAQPSLIRESDPCLGLRQPKAMQSPIFSLSFFERP